MIDVDLSGFGDTWGIFTKNNKNVELELRQMEGDISESDRLKKMIKLLEMFRAREPFYLTEYFREIYQDQARANLDREISRLNNMLLKTAS